MKKKGDTDIQFCFQHCGYFDRSLRRHVGLVPGICHSLVYLRLPKTSGNVTIKKLITVTPSFHCLL
jgi:hypothetical protein